MQKGLTKCMLLVIYILLLIFLFTHLNIVIFVIADLDAASESLRTFLRTHFTDINLYTSSREPRPIPLHKLFVNLVWKVGDDDSDYDQYMDDDDNWSEDNWYRDNEEGDNLGDDSGENRQSNTDDDDDETSGSEDSCHTGEEMNVIEANGIPTLTNIKDSNKNILTIYCRSSRVKYRYSYNCHRIREKRRYPNHCNRSGPQQ